MNRFLKFIICTAAVSLLAVSMEASCPEGEGKDWRERIMSEKIAFLTGAIGLTPEEAQAFWPIKVRNKTDEACADKFRKVLPVEKVAKLYIGEERFRRQQIHKLHHGK